MNLFSGYIELKPGWVVLLPNPMTMMTMSRYRFALFLAIAGGAGIGLSAYGTLEKGKEAAKAGKIQQQQLEAEAKAAEQVGQYESRLKRKEAERTQASQIAQMMANGGLLTGSNLEILAETARNYEDDALVISRNYQMQAINLRNKGALARYEGQLARRASRIRAVSDILSGAALMGLASGIGKSPSGPSYSSTTAKAASTGGGAYGGTGGGGPTGGGSRSMIG